MMECPNCKRLEAEKDQARAELAEPCCVHPDGECCPDPDPNHPRCSDSQLYPDCECECHLAAENEALHSKLESRESELAKARADVERLTKLLGGRAGRLLQRDEPFFVVRADEPYAAQVVALIKAHEGEKWTTKDEEWAQKALKYRRGEVRPLWTIVGGGIAKEIDSFVKNNWKGEPNKPAAPSGIYPDHHESATPIQIEEGWKCSGCGWTAETQNDQETAVKIHISNKIRAEKATAREEKCERCLGVGLLRCADSHPQADIDHGSPHECGDCGGTGRAKKVDS